MRHTCGKLSKWGGCYAHVHIRDGYGSVLRNLRGVNIKVGSNKMRSTADHEALKLRYHHTSPPPSPGDRGGGDMGGGDNL